MEQGKTFKQQLDDMPNTGAYDLMWILKNVGNLPRDKAMEIISHLSERARLYGMKLTGGYFYFNISGDWMPAKDHHALEAFLLEETNLRTKWAKK